MDHQQTLDFQNAVYTLSNAIGGLIEAMGMQALNQHRLSRNEPIAYDDTAFAKVMKERGLYHNNLMTTVYGR